MNNIREVLVKPLEEINLRIDDILYSNKTLTIILDSDDLLDINKIVLATKLISPILDEYDFIKEKYVLDVTSKEKGDN